ncbi:hypothetical protein OB69_13625 [Roseivirga seohaensis subsp. aquiponti]|uniref:Uncharacterized protein n=1 Tax=Roseivirga seohaensis subsp. aquiponti TaxID=1566026 RepID=A0A0L8AI90_9BACT|nr:tetratricopeptide repeat protein [Roseivirga seohaensis]KOF02069.1 hypothetical protein OB69_13625 [Roseivirga seohaensis subsp. aquiponti]
MKNRLSLLVLVLIVFLFSCNDDVTRKGDQLYNEGNFKEAVEAYSEYLKTNPKDIKSLYNRGRAYEELKQLEKAKADFTAVLDVDGDNLNANLSMGKLWYNQKEFNKAIIFFDKVIELDGLRSDAYMLRGRSYHQKGDFEKAMENYNQAINFDNDNAEAFLYRGALKIALNQTKTACQDFTRSKALGSSEASEALAKHCR